MIDSALDHDSLLFAHTPDEALALRASSDTQAFAELYRRYFEPVYRYMRYQVPTQEANDLTAQVFFSAFRAASQFRADATYRSWLFRIAHNAVVSWRRTRERAAVLLPDPPEEPDTGADGATAAVRNDEARALWALVSELKPHERELIELRYVEDLSPKEIAHVTGHSPGAVRVRLHRLLRRLRHRLERQGMTP